MSDVRILVVEDEESWQNSLPGLLSERLGPGLEVEVAGNYTEALQKVRRRSYDLVSVDLKLLGEINASAGPNLPGMDLLKECRASSRNQGCGLVVLSGYATPRAVYNALEHYGVNVFVDKADFGDGGPYIEAAQTAIRRARLMQAGRHLNNRFQLTVTYNQESLIRGDLTGPNHRSESQIDYPSPAGLNDLVRRADELNLRLNRGDGEWRPAARSIGAAVYRTLVDQQLIFSLLSAAQAFTSSSAASSLGLQFSGPPSGLGVPFELMRDEDEYFALKHILTRRLSQGGPRFTQKSDPFFRFIEKLIKKDESLRILIVGANIGGNIPAAEEEASRLADSMRSDLSLLGIPHEITLLLGDNVRYQKLSEALHDNQHIFHFAGHGDFDESLPEKSQLILQDRAVTAADLKLLVQGTDLQFVFLSCCLAARTGVQVGRGDFHGFFQALSQADVPATLAYRWEVKDDSAIKLATEFYRSVWRNFCLGLALLNSRRKLALEEPGRDDETWVAPVLLSQTM